MSQSDNNELGIFNFVKEHPFQSGALVASSTIFLCSCIGFFREYLILKEFGINVVTFAELNDFLVAGLKDPYVLAIFPLILFFFVYSFYILRRKRGFSSKFSKVTIAVSVIYPFAIAFMYIPMFSVKGELREIKELSHPVVIKLRNGDALERASLITTTEKFVFIWESESATPMALTASNIISIKYSDSREVDVQQVNPADAESAAD